MIRAGDRVTVFKQAYEVGKYVKKANGEGVFVDFGIDVDERGMFTTAIVELDTGFLCTVGVDCIRVNKNNH